MRVTLQEEWDGLVAAFETKRQNLLAKVFSERPRPDVVYWLESYKSITALRIDGATVFFPLPPTGKRGPTKKAVAALRAIVGSNPTEDDAYLCYSYDNGFGRTEGWLKVSEFLTGDRHALTREELLPKQQELIEKYAPRDGYKPCDYCGTQRPIQDLKPRTIISRQYPNFKKVGHYCPDTGCGAYDQMAHEG